LEAHLRRRHNNPQMVLSDYFDLVGGTSTGSIIASSIAIGMSASDILDAYNDMGDKIFEHPARWWQLPKWFRQNLFYKNRPAAIEELLQKHFAEPESGRPYLLGDEKLRTGLCIVAKRVDTFSVWHMHNNPKGRYYPVNKEIPLWRLVRASSAAPTFFPPTIMQFDSVGHFGAFVDGGVSAFNNPALQLYLMATLKGYHLEWPTGADQLMIVSVGTGTSEVKYTPDEVRKLGKKSALFWGSTVPDMFIRDCSEFSEMLLQTLSESPTARKIDSELGKLEGDYIAGAPRVHYLRYNHLVTAADVAAAQALTQQDRSKYPSIGSVDDLMKMDAGNHVGHLAEIGKRAAQAQLSDAQFDLHFPKVFDVQS
jgi:patatin-like phospholipase/acyl hydrolase